MVVFMKIHIFTYPSSSTWYGSVMASALKDLGHNAAVTKVAADCFQDDITFLLLCGRLSRPPNDTFHEIKGKSNCIVLMQTEQIFKNKRFLVWLNKMQPHIDAIAEYDVEQIETIRPISKVPIHLLQVGFHKDMITSNDKPVSLPWDVFRLEKAIKSRIQYYKALNRTQIKCFKNIPLGDRNKIGIYSRNSKICLNVHAYGPTATLSAARVIGMFMANHGFCLIQRSNYPNFKHGKHLIYFDDPRDMIKKIRFYIKHQDKARQIAENAFNHISTKLKLTTFLEEYISWLKKIKRI